MHRPQRMTAILSREEDGFVALCPDLDIASQGATIEEARANLVEALTLFFETASSSEIARRLHNEGHGEVRRFSPRSRHTYANGLLSELREADWI